MIRIPTRVPLSLEAEEQSKLQDFITCVRKALTSHHCANKPLSYAGVLDCQHIYVTPQDWGTHLDSERAFAGIMQYSLKALELAHGIGHDIEQRSLNEYGIVVSVLPATEIMVCGTPWYEFDAEDDERSIVIATPSLNPNKTALLASMTGLRGKSHR
ncbi:MAG: hypothetical protein ACK4OE_08550 [Acidovorax sp.]|uniref:hypothetical protein n=1 Tax=Acidovorax sp. TaxID=1872122 RepID=UPI003918949F